MPRPPWSSSARSTVLTTCTAQRADGSFCGGHGVPFAPFPICAKHITEVYLFARDTLRPSVDQDGEKPGDPPGTIYYLRVGQLIKIGHSGNLAARLKAYPPDAVLLATEAGTPTQERDRHRQFEQALAHGKEWFRPTVDLLAHIAAIKAAAA